MAKLSQFKFDKNDQAFDKTTKVDKSASQEEIKDKFNTYKDMSKDQLNSELFKEVARQKSNGSFDYQSLERMVESIRGSLSENDYNNIKRLLESLK